MSASLVGSEMCIRDRNPAGRGELRASSCDPGQFASAALAVLPASSKPLRSRSSTPEYVCPRRPHTRHC
eukprot:3828825-Alexandrium_andersonii.AAC.1